MVDGGRYQAREATGEPGVSNPARHEVKVACCQTLAATAHAADPPRRKRRRETKRRGPRKLVRTVVASTADSGTFGWQMASEAGSYVENNRGRMDYPRYWWLGLPISSAAVESTIKQINRRIKGAEKFWLEGSAEAVLQLRAAHLSEDGRAEDYGSRPRPYARATGQGSLRPAA
jgi:hypothetical protein